MGSNRPAGRGLDTPRTDPLAGPLGSEGGISRALRLRLILIVAVVCLLPSLLELLPQSWLPFSGKGLNVSRAVRSIVG